MLSLLIKDNYDRLTSIDTSEIELFIRNLLLHNKVSSIKTLLNLSSETNLPLILKVISQTDGTLIQSADMYDCLDSVKWTPSSRQFLA